VGHYIHPSFRKLRPEVRMKRCKEFESIAPERVIVMKSNKYGNEISFHQESPTDLYPPIHPGLLPFPPYPSSAALSMATAILTTDKTIMVGVSNTST
jgi:hypothetical protein